MKIIQCQRRPKLPVPGSITVANVLIVKGVRRSVGPGGQTAANINDLYHTRHQLLGHSVLLLIVCATSRRRMGLLPIQVLRPVQQSGKFQIGSDCHRL